MPHNRFYLDASLDQEISLRDEELGHLLVMRPKLQDSIELVNGKGDLAQGTIISIQKQEIIIKIIDLFHEPEDPFPLIIAQGIPRFSRLELILEKGTELGMTSLWLFPSRNSEKTTFSSQQKERIQKILIASLKQSGRLYLPKIHFYPPIEEWKSLPCPAYFGAFKKNIPTLFAAWQKNPPKTGALFIIGPEAGLTEKEEDLLEKLHALPVSLHKNILRTDTAPLAALTLMHTLAQDMNPK